MKKVKRAGKEILIILLIVILILTGFLFFYHTYIRDKTKSTDEKVDENGLIVGECQTNSDCVPESCCHAEKCVSINKKPKCEGFFCTAVCAGPLDCGAGKCGCIERRCEIIPNN